MTNFSLANTDNQPSLRLWLMEQARNFCYPLRGNGYGHETLSWHWAFFLLELSLGYKAISADSAAYKANYHVRILILYIGETR